MKKQENLTGLLCVIGSAVVFGFTPVLAAITYRGGNNGVNMAFLRALLPIPLLLFLGRRLPMPTRAQWKSGLFAGGMSFGCTLLLYSSYEYISPGLATVLHFLYPLYVTVYEAVRARRLPGAKRLCGLALGLAGSVLFLENAGGGSLTGYALAIGSGIAYTLYIIALGREAQKPMPLVRLMFVVSVGGVLLCGAAAVITARLTFALSAPVWLCTVAAALLAAVGGGMLFQRGVRKIGGANAALLSLFEPVTSVIFSVWLLDDVFSPPKLLGCALILSGLLLVTAQRQHTEKSV